MIGRLDLFCLLWVNQLKNDLFMVRNNIVILLLSELLSWSVIENEQSFVLSEAYKRFFLSQQETNDSTVLCQVRENELC